MSKSTFISILDFSLYVLFAITTLSNVITVDSVLLISFSALFCVLSSSTNICDILYLLLFESISFLIVNLILFFRPRISLSFVFSSIVNSSFVFMLSFVIAIDLVSVSPLSFAVKVPLYVPVTLNSIPFGDPPSTFLWIK